MTSHRRSLILSAVLLAGLLGWPPRAFAKERVRRNVEIEWDAIPGASLYEVQVINRNDRHKGPMRFKVHEPKWVATIKPGLYSMQIRSYDGRGVPGDWSPATDLPVRLPSVVLVSPASGGTIEASDSDEQSVKFKWEEVPGAATYKVSARSLNGSWQKEKEVSGTEWSVDIPVGQKIEWNVRAVDPKGEIGDANAVPENFTLNGPPLEKPRLHQPLSKYVQEVEWTPPAEAKTFEYDLSYFDRQTRKWKAVASRQSTNEAKIKWDISRPSGLYRLSVRAEAPARKPSSPATMDFETRGGFRDPASFETAILRDSITKPTNFYAIASYLVTDMSYHSDNYDYNTPVNFSAVGGTGRIGLGYQDPESKWGGFGIADLSGFSIGGHSYTFASSEMHATRKLEFGQRGLLLFGAGFFLKEMPIVLGSNTIGFTGIGKAREIGPHAGFTYWIPLGARFGLQANARLYYSAFGKTTAGPKVKPSASYQYGLLGSYRLTTSWMGYAGYAFRRDEARYEGDPSDPSLYPHPGQLNVIDIQGHYLNLVLEYSF